MKNILLLMSGITLVSFSAKAGVEEELKRLHKCYGLFVREKIPASHSLWKQVQAGSKSGTDACMELFDKASLDSNGEIKKASGQYDYEGMRVLNTFFRFNKSQLEVPDFSTVLGTGVERYTRDVIDSHEAAYHLLYTLFKYDQKYSEIVTRDYSLKSVRYSTKSTRSRSVAVGGTTLPALPQGFYKSVKDANGNTTVVPDPAKGGVVNFVSELPETGLLVGIQPNTTENSLMPNLFPYSSYGFTSTNVTQHHGGGIMGTQAYLMANTGKNGPTDGASALYRRWGKHVLSDLLCRDLPALRSSDVMSEVYLKSTIAYRQGISCMGCHSSMDPLAGTVRHIRSGWSHNTANFPRIKFWGAKPADLTQEPFPTLTRDANFYRRPAWGRLFYRSYDGKLVKEEVVGLEALGETMAETNDLYVCAAKRYYKFLTGISVSLADEGDINTPSFSANEKLYRKRVIEMGLDLKKHQSLRTMIKNIIKSEAFINPDKGV